ncbi:MAG: sugar O-acyltransferase (sialic acid O-acetyltransferase NeuD family) [Flavobacteriaceae bacterium]|jgi:sugar O-acyltransferase (sialic acid O-acetyltransferase NeuD family)
MKKLAIIGAGEFGKQVSEMALLGAEYEPIGFYDDYAEQNEFEGLPILGKVDEIENHYAQHKFEALFVAVGYNHLRFKQRVMHRFFKIPFANIIHPTALIEKSAQIGTGICLYARSYIGPGVQLSDGVVVNMYSYIPHDNIIGECASFSGGVNMGGKTDIASCTFVGLGCTVSDNLSICGDVFIGAGALVVKNIEEPGIYIGSPAKKMN